MGVVRGEEEVEGDFIPALGVLGFDGDVGGWGCAEVAGAAGVVHKDLFVEFVVGKAHVGLRRSRGVLGDVGFLNPVEGLDEMVDFGWGVVEIKGGAGGGVSADAAHERLIAVVACSEGDAAAIGEGDEVVGVDAGEGEAEDAGVGRRGGLAEGAVNAEVGDGAEGFGSEAGEAVAVLRDLREAEGGEELDGDAEGDGAFDVGCSGFKFVREFGPGAFF